MSENNNNSDLCPKGLDESRKVAFAMRDFLEPNDATKTNGDNNKKSDVKSPSPTINLEEIDYIDAPECDEHNGSRRNSDNKCSSEDSLLNSASCRLRRWRVLSRRVRCPRLIENLTVDASDCEMNSLTDRVGSLTTLGTMGELLTPPHMALTAPSSPSSPSFLALPTFSEQNAADSFGSSPECCQDSSVPSPPPGPRYKLITEGTLKVCAFQHSRTIVDKILSSKFLRRWETHTICLSDTGISAKTPCGLLERPITFKLMQHIFSISKWDSANKYCIRIVTGLGSLLLQANYPYTRDQWYHSIMWKCNISKYRSILTTCSRKEIILKELKNMVDFIMSSPLQDETVAEVPLDIITHLLSEESNVINTDQEDRSRWHEAVVRCTGVLLAERGSGGKLFSALCDVCSDGKPPAALAPLVRRILTRSGDFARTPHARQLVKEYISALSRENPDGYLVRRFVEVSHGPRGTPCPHPRRLPNLASVSLSALNDHFRENEDNSDVASVCFADIFTYLSEYDDWRPGLAALIQPVPYIAEVLNSSAVAQRLARVCEAIIIDKRCNVHGCLLPSRTGREGWMNIVSPTAKQFGLPQNQLCKLWADMLGCLLNCCQRRKSFLQDMLKQLPDFLLAALSEHPAALDALCLMLEWNLPMGEQARLEVIATLQGTDTGQTYYQDLCDRQQHLRQLQASGGPRRLALPVRATDADVAALLSAAGSLGNLECLSLAFTSVTSACAYQLIKLPTLRYLNLWATQFGDAGVQLISEHLTKLQVLNLCETPISDKGIEALSALPNLKRLNLNSTKLSAEAFEGLKKRLPQLQEFDIRYTEAW